MDDSRRPTTANPGPTRAQRTRFFLALGLFLLWVATLGVMAALSGRAPEARPAAIER